jgi:hypothetical protein
MSAKSCLAMAAFVIAALCMPARAPKPSPAAVLHVPTACVNQPQAGVSVSGDNIHLVEYHGATQSQSFGIPLKPGQHLGINVVVLAGSKRYVLRSTVCRRGRRLAGAAHRGRTR